MIDTLQIILFVLLVVVIVFFLILGVQVFYLIQDARRTLNKANKVLENTGNITENVSGRIETLNELVGGVTTGTVIAKALGLFIRMATKSDKKGKGDTDE
jgi:hypothetical protein